MNLNHNPSLIQFQVQIKQFITPHRTYECITTIRCLYQREHNPSIWQKLMKLESHCSKRKGTEQYESDRQIIAQFLNRFFKVEPNDFSENDILRICGVIQVRILPSPGISYNKLRRIHCLLLFIRI